jgi:hypothetical protein
MQWYTTTQSRLARSFRSINAIARLGGSIWDEPLFLGRSNGIQPRRVGWHVHSAVSTRLGGSTWGNLAGGQMAKSAASGTVVPLAHRIQEATSRLVQAPWPVCLS